MKARSLAHLEQERTDDPYQGVNVFSYESIDDLGKRKKTESQTALAIKTANEIADQEQPKSEEIIENPEKDLVNPSNRQIAVDALDELEINHNMNESQQSSEWDTMIEGEDLVFFCKIV